MSEIFGVKVKIQKDLPKNTALLVAKGAIEVDPETFETRFNLEKVVVIKNIGEKNNE